MNLNQQVYLRIIVDGHELRVKFADPEESDFFERLVKMPGCQSMIPITARHLGNPISGYAKWYVRACDISAYTFIPTEL